jgi:putative transposase
MHTRHYHFKYQTSGHTWQGKFKSPIISDDEYLLQVMQYIEKNSLRAGIVNRVENYKWSSYLLNVRRQESKIIDRQSNPMFEKFGGSISKWIARYRGEFKKGLTEKDIEMMRKKFYHEDGYMSERFRDQMKEMLPRKRRRGRPRKSELISN